jgi:hypothetical protein
MDENLDAGELRAELLDVLLAEHLMDAAMPFP